MKKTMMTLCGAALLALGCGHMMNKEQPPPAQTTATSATASRSDAQLAIDDAQMALRAADAEFARSGDSEETRRLTEVARQKVEQAQAAAPNEQCRQQVSALQAAADDLSQRQKAQASAQEPTPQKQAPIVLHNYEVSAAELTPAMRQQLDTAINRLAGSDATVVIMGHTDDTGSDEVNQKLSLTRAAAARDYLISKGVDPSRIRTKSAGASAPIAPNDTPENRAKNRRIEIQVTTNKPVS